MAYESLQHHVSSPNIESGVVGVCRLRVEVVVVMEKFARVWTHTLIGLSYLCIWSWDLRLRTVDKNGKGLQDWVLGRFDFRAKAMETPTLDALAIHPKDNPMT